MRHPSRSTARRCGQLLILVFVTALLASCNGSSGGKPTGSIEAPATTAAVLVIKPPAGRYALLKRLPPNSKRVQQGALTVQLVGNCNSDRGRGIYMDGRNFPPNSTFKIKAYYPDATPYHYLQDSSLVDDNGRTSFFNWDCWEVPTGKEPDKPGKGYRLILTVPGYSPITLEFQVSYPRPQTSGPR